MRNIFIIGSKGIPAKYGGFETFVEQLTAMQENRSISYHVACLGSSNREFVHNGARCFEVNVPKLGSARAVLYDVLALRQCIAYIRKHKLESSSSIYILACRIGPFLTYYSRILKRMGVKLYINPDGHEWKRGKWNRWIRAYWKMSERLMIARADLVICDSMGIEKYIREEYRQYSPRTTFIAYGATVHDTRLPDNDDKLMEWYRRHNVKPQEYYLIVGRFVPENNYELMISEYIRSSSAKDLVIISNVEKNDFYKQLQERTNFEQDRRIKFVGTVYDQQLLTTIREQAAGYFHGHEVGGTNPSLLEALAVTQVNLLLDVVFNREVGEDAALYFSKQSGSLAATISEADRLTEAMRHAMGQQAKKRILDHYSWRTIVDKYEMQFMLGDMEQSKQQQATYTVSQGVLKQ